MKIIVFKKTSLRIVMVFIAATLMATQSPAMNAEEQMVFADGLMARGMYELAVVEYKKYLRDFVKNGKADVAHFRLAECYRYLKKYSVAEKLYKHIFQKCPNSKYRFRAGFRRADLFMKTKQYDGAIKLFKELLEAKPPLSIAASSQYFLGESYEAIGQPEQALKIYSLVREKYKNLIFSAYATLKIGEVYGANPKTAGKAMELYQEVSADPPNDRIGAEAIFMIAELFYRAKQYDLSSEAYGKLLDKYPHDERSVEAKLRAAWSYHNAGLYAEALKISTSELALRAELTEALPKAGEAREQAEKVIQYAYDEWFYLKANCERQLTKSSEAVETYILLIKGFPKTHFDVAARYELALTYYNMGKYKNAVGEAKKIDLAADDVKYDKDLMAKMQKDVMWLLAESYTALKQEDEAIQYYRLIAKDHSKSDIADDAMYRLAHNLQTKKSYKEASRYYSMIAANFPNSDLTPQSLYASAFCLAKEGMHKESVRDWSILIVKYTSSPLIEEAFYQKAMSEINMKRDTEAVISLRQLLKKYPKSDFAADSHYWVGLLLKQAGNLHDAEAELRQAVELKPRLELEREAAYQLAVILQKTGRSKDAIALFQQLLKTPMKKRFSPALLEWMAEYLYRSEKYADAAVASKALIDITDEDVWKQIGWCLLGRSKMSLGKMDDAEEAFALCMSIPAKTSFAAEAALRIGEIALNGAKYDDAMKYMSLAAGMASGDNMLSVRAHAYAGLGKVARAQKDFNNASRYFMTVAILYDDEALVSECLRNAADAFNKLGKKDEAKKAIAEMKKRYPKQK